ncbi:MAG TPA: DUF2231 domain-containing protein [Myxococcota bacterium]
MLEIPDPLHPAVVHFPIAIAALLPVVLALAAFLTARRPCRRVWSVVLLLHLIGAGGAWLAGQTGHEQEERVEQALGDALEQPIHEHEEKAEALIIAFWATLVVTAAGLLRGSIGAVARVAAVAGGIVLAVLAVQAGGSGGELVYRHGAASAYVGAPQDAPAPP